MSVLKLTVLASVLAVGTVMAQAPAPQGAPGQGAPGGAPGARGPAGPPAVPTVVKVGDMAPDFRLQGTDGKTHKLSEYRGKTNVVVAWFPKAFTQGCTIECKSLAENGDKIKKYDVVYFMASVDNIDDNTEFAKATKVSWSAAAARRPARSSTRRKPTSRCSPIRRRRRRRRTACSTS